MKKYTFTELREGLTDAEIASVCGVSLSVWFDFIATQKEMAMMHSCKELCEALEKKQTPIRDYYDEHGVLDYSKFI